MGDLMVSGRCTGIRPERGCQPRFERALPPFAQKTRVGRAACHTDDRWDSDASHTTNRDANELICYETHSCPVDLRGLLVDKDRLVDSVPNQPLKPLGILVFLREVHSVIVPDQTRRGFLSVAAVGAVRLSGCLDEDEENDEEYNFDDQPEDASVSFETPSDGDTVESPVEIVAEVDGIDLEPAGTMEAGTGHLHILVDHDCYEVGEVMPGPSEEAEDDGIFHWSDGQSEDELELEPGDYELCIQIGDGDHRAFGETDEISITVE